MVLPEDIDCLLNGELRANYRFTTLILKARLTEIVKCVKRSESMYLGRGHLALDCCSRFVLYDPEGAH
jgi:hypothetical protein